MSDLPGSIPEQIKRSGDFNLRDVKYHGKMLKRGDVNTNFKERYFVLTDSFLFYYRMSGIAKARLGFETRLGGKIDFDHVYKVEDYVKEHEKQQFVIMLFTETRIWTFSCLTEESQSTWMAYFLEYIADPKQPDNFPDMLSLSSIMRSLETSPSTPEPTECKTKNSSSVMQKQKSHSRSLTPPRDAPRRHSDNNRALLRQKHTHRRLKSTPIPKISSSVPYNESLFDENEEKITEETVKLDYTAPIPKMLINLKDTLCRTGGLEREGIFRIEPPSHKKNAVMAQFLAGNFHDCHNPHMVASLTKLWLRNRPTNILDGVENIKTLPNKKHDFPEALQLIPEPERSLFMCVVDICVLVNTHRDQNKMGPEAMAIVIAPNLWQPELTEDLMIIQVYNSKVVDFLISAILWRIENS